MKRGSSAACSSSGDTNHRREESVGTWFRRVGRYRPIGVVQVLALAGSTLMAGGCSEAGSADRAANSPLSVEVSQMFVTIRNTAGLPLTEVRITIVPFGRPTEFTKFYGRIENSEKRDISLGDFNSRDGTRLDLRVVRPKAIRIKAQDVNGKTYDVELPWD